MRTWAEQEFDAVGFLVLDRDPEGAALEFMPQARYANVKGKRLNPHGTGPFCRFRLPGAASVAGVYILTEDDSPVYVGICEHLANRWGLMGYGSISPINCFVGGQSTNCKINSRVLVGDRLGRRYEVWFASKTEGRRAVEIGLIRDLRPPWNGTR
jgi:hypothetical protein